MSKFANIVTVEVQAGRVPEVLRALISHKERSLRGEPGILQSAILRSKTDDSRLLTYELYVDEAAFEKHRAASSLTQFVTETSDKVVRLTGVRCALIE